MNEHLSISTSYNLYEKSEAERRKYELSLALEFEALGYTQYSIDECVSTFGNEIIHNDRLFRVGLITTDLYRNKDGGVTHFSKEDLIDIAKFHSDGIKETMVALYDGHEDKVGTNRKAIGWFFPNGIHYGEFTYQDDQGRSKLFSGLIGDGYYTDYGQVSSGFRYLSSELRIYKRRRVDETKDNDGRTYISGAALVNNPFYEMPNIGTRITRDMLARNSKHTWEVNQSEMANVLSERNHAEYSEKVFRVNTPNSSGDQVQLMYRNEDGTGQMFSCTAQQYFSLQSDTYFKEEPDMKIKKKRDAETKEQAIESATKAATADAVEAAPDAEAAGVEGAPVDEEAAADATDVGVEATAEVEAPVLEEGEALSADAEEAPVESATEEAQAEPTLVESLLAQMNEAVEEMKALKKQNEELAKAKEEESRILGQLKASNEALKAEVQSMSAKTKEAEQANYSLRVEGVCTDLHSKGYPTAMIETVRKMGLEVELDSRDVKMNFSNAEDESKYTFDFLDTMTHIIESIPAGLFSRSNEVLDNDHKDSKNVQNTAVGANEKGVNSFLALHRTGKAD